MKVPYGKTPRKTTRSTKRSGANAGSKYKLRGKHAEWLDMPEVQQGILEILRDLKKNFPGHRAKWATFCILIVDPNGKEVLIHPSGEKVLHPYKSAADEYGA